MSEAPSVAAATVPTTATQPLLELEDVHVYYGAIHALKGVSLRIDEGQIVAA